MRLMMVGLLVLLLIVPVSSSVCSFWVASYGGSSYDYASSIQQTSDGGYIVAGGTYSFGAGSKDVWVLKIDSEGEIPGCEVVGESDAIVMDSTATVTNTNADVYITGVTVIDTEAFVTSTDASANYVCCYARYKPVVGFTYEIEGMMVTFDASMSYDPDEVIVSYEWEFGDGSVETTTTPIVTHT